LIKIIIISFEYINIFFFFKFQSQSTDIENKQIDPAILEHIQAIQSLLKKQPSHLQQLSTSPQVKKSDTVRNKCK